MTELEKRQIFFSCERYVNGHGPQSILNTLDSMRELVAPTDFPDVYGSGDMINSFEKEIAQLLGKEAALFLPSGTMAQNIALRIWCDHKKSAHFAMHATSHLELHEEHAYKYLHNLSAQVIGRAKEMINLKDVQELPSYMAALLIELPYRELGGVLPAWSELEQISLYCRKHQISLHMDGARLWESQSYYDKTYSEICALFDSVYVSFYKGIGGITGAALAGPEQFIREARVWLRRQGGNLYTLFPYVISARSCFEKRILKMKDYCEHAKKIAFELSKIPGVRVEPPIPQTNMMHIYFSTDAKKLENAFYKLSAKTKIGTFRRIWPSDNAVECKTEMSVGDATLNWSAKDIAQMVQLAMKNEFKN